MVPEEGEVWAQVRVGWTSEIGAGKRRGVFCAYFSFFSEVCVSPGLVGDTRREEQDTHLSVGKGIAQQSGRLVVQAAVPL